MKKTEGKRVEMGKAEEGRTKGLRESRRILGQRDRRVMKKERNVERGSVGKTRREREISNNK